MAQYKTGFAAFNNGAAPGGLGGAATTGGGLGAATYYYVVSAYYQAGESVKSSEISVVVSGGNNAVQLNWTAVPGAVKYRVYRGTSSGGQGTYYETATNSFLDTGAAGTSGAPKSSSNVAQIVMGLSTAWLANAKAGDLIKKTGEATGYEVAAVEADDRLVLSAFYAGENIAGWSEYHITREFTPVLRLTEIDPLDTDKEYHLTRGVIRKIDELMPQGSVSGLFQIDIDGDLTPINNVASDNNFELDGDGDIMPKEA